MQKGHIDALIAYIGEHFVFNEKKYPELAGASEKELYDFAVRHVALHLAKFGGKVAAVSEDVDHGGEGDTEDIKKSIPRLLISVLELAYLLKMPEEEILRAIEEKYKAPIG